MGTTVDSALGVYDSTRRVRDLPELTSRQTEYIRFYPICNGRPECIAKKAKWFMPDGSLDDKAARNAGRSKRVQMELSRIARHNNTEAFLKSNYTVAKDDRLELLWLIAQGGAERILDKEGNMVFMNPAVSISAIRTMNEMIPGSLAPKEIEVTHKQEDTRTEDEIKESIAKLQQEYQSLVAIDGQTITLKESDIKDSESLPLVKPSGKIVNDPLYKVHVPARRELE